MKKLLKEARKAEDEDNIIEFPQVKPNGQPPSGNDWLRGLPNHSRFVCRRKATKGPYLDGFGIGAVLPECILLGGEDDYKPGIKWNWVDSAEFSKQYQLIALLPNIEEELENQPEKTE